MKAHYTAARFAPGDKPRLIGTEEPNCAACRDTGTFQEGGMFSQIFDCDCPSAKRKPAHVTDVTARLLRLRSLERARHERRHPSSRRESTRRLPGYADLAHAFGEGFA